MLRGNVIGTYLHGPLLPKNAWFADWLIATRARARRPLAPLDDALEDAAHAARAGGRPESELGRHPRRRSARDLLS